MTARNTYATLAEMKAYHTARGQTAGTDATDDVVIDNLLEAASRFLDEKTGRWFYPRIETRYYSIPADEELALDADLLDVVSLTNGDATSIAAAAYNLLPRNSTPKYALQIKDTSSVVWESDSDGGTEFVLTLIGTFGYHDRYADAWKSAGTLGAAISDTTTLAFTMTGGHTVAVGKILKIDSELYIVDTVATNTITPLKRGDNGSTAATHLNGAAVSAWMPMEEIRQATLEIAARAYKRRFGQSQGNDSTVTASGFVLPPKDIPAMAQELIASLQRTV